MNKKLLIKKAGKYSYEYSIAILALNIYPILGKQDTFMIIIIYILAMQIVKVLIKKKEKG